MQKRLISALLYGWISFAAAQPSSILSPKDDNWVINERTRIGATERVKAQSQDPYPFCFSAAAALLWDQHRCTYDKKNCSAAPQTSLLAITPAGQKLPDNEVNVNEGGIAFLSLKRLIEKGYVTTDKCGFQSNITPDYLQGTEHTITMSAMKWAAHNEYAPYLARAYRKMFSNEVKKVNSSLSNEKIDEILVSNLTGTRLFGELLLTESCFKDLQVDDRFTAKLKRIDNEPRDPKAAFDFINQLLAKKNPVLIALCLNEVDRHKQCHNRHTAIIVAQAKAKHKVTGDTKTFYWVVNTWGEQWQSKNSDGWVAADRLIDNLLREVIWLEAK